MVEKDYNAINEGIQRESLPNRIFRIPEIGVLIPLIVITLIFGSIKPVFLSTINILTIVRAIPFYGIVAIGMAYALIAGQIDISVGSVAGLSAIMAGIFIVKVGMPIGLGMILALLIAAFIGLINGILSVKLKIPAIIVTLGMLYAARGAIVVLTEGRIIYPLTESLNNFGKATPLGTSWSFIIYVVLIILCDFVLRKTILGRKIYATGANVLVARLNGINTDLVRISTHVFVSFLAGLAGILFMFSMKRGSPNIGVGWEFLIIAGTIIGGVSLLGGFGTVWGAFLGIIIMQVIFNGLVLVGVKPAWQTIVLGAMMVSAAGFDTWRRTRKT